MKHFLFLFFCVIMLFPCNSFADSHKNSNDKPTQKTNYGYILQHNSAVNLRFGAGTTYDVITAFPGKTFARILSEHYDGNGSLWYQIETLSGTVGYIHSNYFYVIPEGELSPFLQSTDYHFVNKTLLLSPIVKAALLKEDLSVIPNDSMIGLQRISPEVFEQDTPIIPGETVDILRASIIDPQAILKKYGDSQYYYIENLRSNLGSRWVEFYTTQDRINIIKIHLFDDAIDVSGNNYSNIYSAYYKLIENEFDSMKYNMYIKTDDNGTENNIFAFHTNLGNSINTIVSQYNKCSLYCYWENVIFLFDFQHFNGSVLLSVSVLLLNQMASNI